MNAIITIFFQKINHNKLFINELNQKNKIILRQFQKNVAKNKIVSPYICGK